MITGVSDTAMPHQPEEGGVISQDATRAFWKGALLGVAAAVVTLSAPFHKYCYGFQVLGLLR